MSTGIVWFRRDLRLADHAALRAALDRHEQIVPLYVHSPDDEKSWTPGAASRWWLHHSLAALGDSLEKCGAPLVIREGGSLGELRAVAKAVKAEGVYWNRLYEPALVARDEKIKQALREDGLDARSCNAALLFEPWELATQSGGPYKVFSPLWRNIEARLREALAGGRAPLPAPRKIAPAPHAPKGAKLESLALLPKIRWDAGFEKAWAPGEAGAHRRAKAFCDQAIAHYREKRDFPAIDAGSRLSPHLHFGELSPLQLSVRIEQLLAEHHGAGLRGNAEWFVRELGWREFAHHLLYHFPKTPDQPLYEKFAPFPWRAKKDYAADLRAWQRGRTGVPIVDAGMRQLWHTGWMHNRVRMIVASFLTKNLLIPWQEGAAWFWDTLVDADLANNTLGWQWSAGCGADAAPYFRIFNPVLQSAKFDGEGDYIREWVPELAKLDVGSIHAPWQAKETALSRAGVVLDRDYPKPVVDLAESRDRALSAYKQLR